MTQTDTRQPAEALDLSEAIRQAGRMQNPGGCDCCGKRRAGEDDTYRQPDGRLFCGNCDGGEQPDCPNCKPPAFFGVLDF